jgi:hypothetical protein
MKTTNQSDLEAEDLDGQPRRGPDAACSSSPDSQRLAAGAIVPSVASNICRISSRVSIVVHPTARLNSPGTDDGSSSLKCTSTYDCVFETIMAGYPAHEVMPHLQNLTGDERQTLLCTVCSMLDEITCNCRDHGAEVATILTLGCPLFLDGRATCLVAD